MKRPLVAIVGQPNVGKSTLFNRIISERLAVVSPVPGVTRDRNYHNYTWRDREYTLIDTGGLEIGNFERNPKEVYDQASLAIAEAEVILFVVDAAAGITALDEEICRQLRSRSDHTILVVNKVDNQQREMLAADFYSLGIGPVYNISAEHGQGIGELLDEITSLVKPLDDEPEEEDDSVRIAIVGRPNVGKSSLINSILGENRLVVTPKPGTTRDSIDTTYEYEGSKYVLVDTAGIRKRGRVSGSPEYYSIIRSVRSINRCDVACLIIDADEGITSQDARVGSYCEEAGCGIVLVFNKWDLVEKDTHTVKKYFDLIERDLPFLKYAPPIFISAITKQRIFKIFPLCTQINEEINRRISTSQLNRFFREATERHAPFSTNNRRLNLLYITQTESKPPHFTIFYNGRGQVAESYKRYLKNRLREQFGFAGCPILLSFRRKKRDEP